MPRITQFGNQVQLTFGVQLDAIKTLEKENPEVLILKDEEDKPVFRVMSGETSEISNLGIRFSTKNRDGLATLTKTFDVEPEEFNVKVTETFFVPYCKLAELEKTVPEIVEELEAKKHEFLENIEVIE